MKVLSRKRLSKKVSGSESHSVLDTRYSVLLFLLRFLGLIVPRRLRADWRMEWEAELRWREQQLAVWDKLDLQNKLSLWRYSTGAFVDALWLQPKRWEDEMIQDLRYGIRMLVKNKSFSLVAFFSLALGIGANTAIFQLLDAVRLRMLPVKAPHELAEVRLADMRGARGGVGRTPSVTNRIWEQIRDRQQAFSKVSAWFADNINLAPGGEVRTARLLYVSGDFFNTVGVAPTLGRLFNPADDQRGCGDAGLIISHAFWQREFGGEENIIGRRVTLADHQFEIIGVTPASFFGMEVGRTFDLALPICANPIVRGNNNTLESGMMWLLTVVGRLRPDWSLDQATAHMQAISPALFETTLPANYPPPSVKDYLDSKLITVPAGAGISRLRENYEQSLWLLLAISGLVLMIACANVANLLMARAAARAREIAIRRALGASRQRLVRQLLVESLLLAAMGGALGVALAQALSRFLVAFLSTSADPLFLDLGPDWRLLGFAAAMTVLTCLLFGLAPALRATRLEPGVVMKAGGREITGDRISRHRWFNLRQGLVVVQVALSLVLVAGALLFTRSLNNLLTVDTGFRPDNILSATIVFQRMNLSADRVPAFREELQDRIRSIPGVEAAAIGMAPLSGSGGLTIWMDGADARQGVKTSLSGVGPDYFRTLQIPLLAGREFNVRDRANAPRVAVVNEAFARRFMNGENPVGRRFWIEAFVGDPDTLYEIVGLVRDTKYGDLREEFRPIVYTPRAQDSRAGPGDNYLIRSRLAQTETVAAVKRILNEIHPAITVNFRAFKPMLESTILRERLMATLSGFFGLLALLLACIGLYGILSYVVTSRTHEIGIRMALGARPRDVRQLVLREAFILIAAGLAVGLPLVFATTRLAATLLYGLAPTDPVSLLGAALLMLFVAAVAGYLPARRATRVDPMVALRDY